MDDEIKMILLKAINKIDDYFEYSNESKKDKEYVRDVLGKMDKEIRKLIE